MLCFQQSSCFGLSPNTLIFEEFSKNQMTLQTVEVHCGADAFIIDAGDGSNLRSATHRNFRSSLTRQTPQTTASNVRFSFLSSANYRLLSVFGVNNNHRRNRRHCNTNSLITTRGEKSIAAKENQILFERVFLSIFF